MKPLIWTSMTQGPDLYALNFSWKWALQKTVLCPKDGLWMSDITTTIQVLAAPEGIEPSTSDLEGPCSIQLSYGAARERFIQTLRVLS